MLLAVPEVERSNVRAQHPVMAFTVHHLGAGGRWQDSKYKLILFWFVCFGFFIFFKTRFLDIALTVLELAL